MTTLSEPLLLVNLPDGVLTYYTTLTNYVTGHCGLSIRYVSSQGSLDANRLKNIQDELVKCVLNNRSLRCNTPANVLSNEGYLQSEHCRNMHFKFDTRMPKLSESMKRKEVEAIVAEPFEDSTGVVKMVGRDIQANGQTYFLPLWAVGMCASQGDRYQDRELKFCVMDPRISDPANFELQTVLLAHSFIEAGWWCPNVNVPPHADDSKKLISSIVDSNLVYWPVSTLTLMLRLKLYEQHFDSMKQSRKHNSVSCGCSKLRDYDYSFIAQKVSSLKAAILPGIEREEKDGLPGLTNQFTTRRRASVALSSVITFIEADFHRQLEIEAVESANDDASS